MISNDATETLMLLNGSLRDVGSFLLPRYVSNYRSIRVRGSVASVSTLPGVVTNYRMGLNVTMRASLSTNENVDFPGCRE